MDVAFLFLALDGRSDARCHTPTKGRHICEYRGSTRTTESLSGTNARAHSFRQALEAGVLYHLRLAFHADELTVLLEEKPALAQATQPDIFGTGDDAEEEEEGAISR